MLHIKEGEGEWRSTYWPEVMFVVWVVMSFRYFFWVVVWDSMSSVLGGNVFCLVFYEF
jgi:acyl-CoA reductase-like NAD-dependent aldehyde dehydrogenase